MGDEQLLGAGPAQVVSSSTEAKELMLENAAVEECVAAMEVKGGDLWKWKTDAPEFKPNLPASAESESTVSGEGGSQLSASVNSTMSAEAKPFQPQSAEQQMTPEQTQYLQQKMQQMQMQQPMEQQSMEQMQMQMQQEPMQQMQMQMNGQQQMQQPMMQQQMQMQQMNGQMPQQQMMNGQQMQMQQMNGQMNQMQMNGQMNQMQMNGQMNQMHMNGQMQQMNGQGMQGRRGKGQGPNMLPQHQQMNGRGNAQRNGLQQPPVKMLPGVQPTRPQVPRDPLMRAQQNLASAGERKGLPQPPRNLNSTPAELAQYLRSRGGSAPLSSVTGSVVQSRPDLFQVENGSVILREAEPAVVELYVVAEAFAPSATEHGELALQVGELVAVTQQHTSGWWRGDKVKMRSGAEGARTTGWFPGAFVDKLVGTLNPRGGRAAIYDVAAQKLVRYDPKTSRLSVDLAGFSPPLADEDCATFAQWLEPRLAGQRGQAVVQFDVSRNAIGPAGLGALLDVLLRQDVALAALDVSSNNLGDEALVRLGAYLQQTSRPQLQSLELRATGVERASVLRLLSVLAQRLGKPAPQDVDAPLLQEQLGLRLGLEADESADGCETAAARGA